MMIYDLRVQYFPSSPNYGTAYVLDRKAREYLTFNPSDREGVRKLYKEAIEAGLQSGVTSVRRMSHWCISAICAMIIRGARSIRMPFWMSTLVWLRFSRVMLLE